jgi:hypothetical protein
MHKISSPKGPKQYVRTVIVSMAYSLRGKPVHCCPVLVAYAGRRNTGGHLRNEGGAVMLVEVPLMPARWSAPAVLVLISWQTARRFQAL